MNALLPLLQANTNVRKKGKKDKAATKIVSVERSYVNGNVWEYEREIRAYRFEVQRLLRKSLKYGGTWAVKNIGC